MHKPHGRYDYRTDIKATIFGVKDEEITLFHDFECEVEIVIDIRSTGWADATCSDVFVDGHSLPNGDSLSRLIKQKIMDAVEIELELAGPIWDKVREAEGLSMIGHPGDPDARWVRS